MTNYVAFTKAYPFIIGLVFSLVIVDYTLVRPLIDYLTEVWINLGLQRAVQIVSLREGVTKIAKFIINLLDERYGRHFDHFPAVVGLDAVYVVGLFMLMVLDPHEVKKLYLAIFFISLGKAGNESLKLFIKDQVRGQECGKVNEERVETRANVWWYLPTILAACLVPFLDVPWDTIQIFLAVTLLVELLGFCSGKPLHAFEYRNCNRNMETPAANKVYNVVRAAILKRHLSPSKSSRDFYLNDKDHYKYHLPPDVSYLRWLEKAAIVDESKSLEQQVNDMLLFRVEQVVEVKHVLLPLFYYAPTLLLYSISQAAGTTFYLDQAQNINDQFPLVVFIIIKQFSAKIASYLPTIMGTICGKKSPFIITIGIVFSLLSSLIALVVEVCAKKTSFNLSVLWIAPQFIFLGISEGFVTDGIEGLRRVEDPGGSGRIVSESMRSFELNSRQFVIGIGRLLHISIVSWRKIYTPGGRFYYYGLLGFFGLGNTTWTKITSNIIKCIDPIREIPDEPIEAIKGLEIVKPPKTNPPKTK